MPMALEMRGDCDRCKTMLVASGEGLIGYDEHTFRSDCAMAMASWRPNGSELVRRPRWVGP